MLDRDLDRPFGESLLGAGIWFLFWFALVIFGTLTECRAATATLTHQGNAPSYSLPVARWTIDPVKARELDTIRKRTYCMGQTVTNGVVIQHLTNGHKSWVLTNRVAIVQGASASNRFSEVVSKLQADVKIANENFWNQAKLTDAANRRAELQAALYAKATNSNAAVVNWLETQKSEAVLPSTKTLIQTFIDKIKELQQANGQ